MSNNEKPSKKAVKEKKAKTIEDATFGLKNKNKSKKVQQFISRVEKSVKNSGGTDPAKLKDAKKETKLLKQLQEEELRVLFNEGISNQFGKKKSKAKDTAMGLGLMEMNKEVSDLLDNISSDSEEDDEDDYKKRNRNNEVIYLSDEPAAIEVFREKTIEDIIEEQRAKLAAEGKVGTPVTAESFAKWRASKLMKRQAEAEARVKAEQSKKKGGKGLSVLSGKELFNYNASLFVDDEEAMNASDEIALNEETRLATLKEEERVKAETERAQEEQLRLAEIQRIEYEARMIRYEVRRTAAKDPNRVTFMLNEVMINQVVFEEDDEEDLAPFNEEILVDAEKALPIEESSSSGYHNSNSSSSGYHISNSSSSMASYMHDNNKEVEGEDDEGENDDEDQDEDEEDDNEDDDDDEDEADEGAEQDTES